MEKGSTSVKKVQCEKTVFSLIIFMPPMSGGMEIRVNNKENFLRIFSIRIRSLLTKAPIEFDRLQEIRLRINAPIILVYNNQEYFLNQQSRMVKEIQDTFWVSKNEIRETMEYISNYSLYAFEDEIRQGFITIQGGHRIGIAGKVILEGGTIKSIKHISFINIRLSHQVKGCADRIMPYLYDKGEKEYYHTLLISPPRCGKTTLLRDIIRQISDGTCSIHGMSVGVVDERSEIGACYMGVSQNELGIRTDILDCCPKAEGMMMLIRSMSPRVIAVDEIGAQGDIEAIEYVINCGCRLIATVHGSSLEDVRNKPVLGTLVNDGIFKRYVVLSNRKQIGTIEGIYNEKGEALC